MKGVYLYVTPFFPRPRRHFGAYGYDFVSALRRTGAFDRVEVFASGSGRDYEFAGMTVHTFRRRMPPSGILPWLYERHNVRSFLERLADSGISPAEVTVCHGNTAQFAVYPLAVKRLNPKCKTLLHHHDLASVGLRMGLLRHLWPHKVVNYLKYRREFEQIDCHLYISSLCQRNFEAFPDTAGSPYDDYRRLGRGMGAFRPVRVKDSYVLWNGVDRRLFSPSAGERRNGGFTIGCIANFIEVKDHLGLVKAVHSLMGKIPGLRLELLGTNGLGHYREDVEAYVKEHHLEAVVSILPHCRHAELPAAYRRWDVFVMPSYFEGLGCVFLESWCCGTPFIGCAQTGIEDVLPVEDRQRWLAKPRDPADLAAKILDYYNHRYEQRLVSMVDIDELMRKFLRKLEDVRV